MGDEWAERKYRDAKEWLRRWLKLDDEIEREGWTRERCREQMELERVMREIRIGMCCGERGGSEMVDLRLTSTDPVQRWGWVREIAGEIWAYNWQGDPEDIYERLAEELVANFLEMSDSDEMPEWWDATWRERLIDEVKGYVQRDLEEKHD